MDKKSTKLLHNPVPLKIRTEEDIGRERRDFFRNCERISRAPASIFLDGNRFSRKAKLFALPFYAYAGIEKGHYERFMYEEFEWRKPSSEKIPYFIENGKIRKRLPYEEKIMFRSRTPISSVKNDRNLHYQIYLNEEVKRQMVRNQELRKLIKEGKIYEAYKSDKTNFDFEGLGAKFKDYFKVKVWSEIPSNIGLNEGAAIATAVAFLVDLELFQNEVGDKLITDLSDLKMNRPEEIVVDMSFIQLFAKAMQLDFFANGAAVFASIMGNSRKQDTINYECLFYSEMKRFFEPRPEISHKDIKLHMQAFEKIRKVKGINAYFDECSNLSKKTLDTTPLFNWNYSKIEFKNKQELALSVMERRYISGDDRDFKVPSDTDVKLHLLSQVAFAVIGDPSLMVLCERKPEKYIFGKEKDEVYSKYSPLYSSRTNGWEVQGVSVIELKKPKEAELKKPEGEKVEYEKLSDLEKTELELGYLNGEYIVKINDKTIEEFKTSENDFARFLRLAVAMATNEKNRDGQIYKYDEPDNSSIDTKNFNLYIGGFRQEGEQNRRKQDKQKKRDAELYDLRNFLGNCESLRLSRAEKRKLIWSKKHFREVRLGVKFKKITIKNIKTLENFKSVFSRSIKNKYGTPIAQINEALIKDAYNAHRNLS